MSEEYTTGAQIPDPDSQQAKADADAREAWNEVVRSLDELGKAVGQWANAVKDDPENRRRARHVQDKLADVGKDIGTAADRATKTDFAQQVGAAAVAAGDIAVGSVRRVGEEVGPHLADAFRSLAEVIRGAADKVDRQPEQSAEESAAESRPSPVAAPYVSGEEPPAPAPSGTPDERSEYEV